MDVKMDSDDIKNSEDDVYDYDDLMEGDWCRETQHTDWKAEVNDSAIISSVNR